MESKTIGVVGLGLMGASLCKALGAQGHRILGRAGTRMSMCRNMPC